MASDFPVRSEAQALREQLAAKDAEIAELRAAVALAEARYEQANKLHLEEMDGHMRTNLAMLDAITERNEARSRLVECEEAVDQAVALAEYLEGHSKGAMAERVKTALSAKFAQERHEYIARLERETLECAQIVGAALMPGDPVGLHVGHLPDMCRDLASEIYAAGQSVDALAEARDEARECAWRLYSAAIDVVAVADRATLIFDTMKAALSATPEHLRK